MLRNLFLFRNHNPVEFSDGILDLILDLGRLALNFSRIIPLQVI